ncbi:tight junction protein ZO-3 isoform X1 [Acipenser ruthenus]|uniref:tight junction protein ZO-3 isoform X1 n=2 Tax=Acipenser ruthenus TaxID=7906 RepID=UPI002740FC92|nr:tight junction protein ZO-3 isoform X1 [Acipenser ruthenus]
MAVRFKDEFTEMEDLKIWEQYTITLNKDSKVGFGIAVSGGWDKPNPSSGDPAVIISDVVRGGPAMGRLQTLDHIVMVNGVSMEKATSTYAIQHLKNCGRTANITVKRPRTIQVPVSAPRGVSQNSSRSEDLSLRRDAPSDFDKGYPAPWRGSQGERAPRPPSDLDSGSERSYDRSPSNSAPTRWSPAPERNGNVLPLMSGYKSLPKYEDPYKPIKAILVKKDPKEEFGLKLGSQIFVKYMTPTGLASREGTLQEGDIILKINGIVTENLSLEDTKRLVARSASKLSMTVLRDDRQFLVCIPELQDSDVASNASSELEYISDLESESTLPPPQKKDLQDSRGQHSERIRAEPMQPDLRAARYPDRTDHPRGVSTAGRHPNGDNSDPDSDRTPSPSPPRKKAVQNSRGQHRERTRAEPVQAARDSDSASLPRVLPAVMRRPAEEDSDSDHTQSPPQKDSRDSRGQHRDRKRPTSKQSDVREARDADRANFPRWKRPTEDLSDPGSEPAPSEHTASLPREIHSQDSRGQYRERIRPQSAHDSDSDSLPRVLPVPLMRPPPDHSDLDSERTPSPPRRDDSLDSRENFNGRLPPAPNGKMLAGVEVKEAPAVYAAKEDEPIYCLPPESPPRRRVEPREEPNLGYSSDLKRIGFVKEDSVGLRLAGGNDVGIFVGGVKPGSLASQQGIEEGDQILKVNGVDFGSFTREEAALYLLQIPKGEQVIIQAQSKLDIYRKMLQSNVGDSFYIRTHFDHEGEGPGTLSFTRGDVFRVLDTMHRGKLGTWRAVRMSNILQEADRGTIPNKSRAEQLASTEQTQRSSGSSSSTPSSRLRAEFWKLRGLRGAKKSNRKSREDLSQLTIQGKFPPYEKVFLREATFKRPIVILGPLSDVAIQKLSTEMPAEFQTALMVPRNSEEGSSSVIKLETVRQISEQDRHPLLDITPSAVERLNYIQYHPMVLFLDPESRQDVKAMRQQLCPQSNKSSRRLYTQAIKMRKYCPHLFSARIPLLPDSNVWFEILKDRIKELQARPVWFSEDKAESGEEEEDLDALSRSRSTDYLSCDSRATSDYEDTDGEACADNELDEAFEGPALGRSSEPALLQNSEPALARSSEPAWEEEDSSHKPYRTHSYSDEPRVWVSAPGADRLTPELESTPPDLREVPDHRGVPDHPKQPSFSQPQGQQQRLFGGAIDHQAVLWRRPQIRGSMSSEEEEEDKDFDWGPATDL